jgi:PAS domain S-box-containing protein
VRILKLPASQKDIDNEFWLQRIHPEDADALAAVIAAVHADASQSTFEAVYRFLCGDNTYIYLSDRGYLVRDEKGRVERIIGATRDITEKKMAEEELRKFSIIAKETVNAVIVTRPDGNIEWVNEAFTRITEYSREESIGKKPGILLQGPETATTEIDYMRRCIERQQSFTCEIVNYSKTGRKYWIKIQAQPIFDNKGRLKHFFAIETDITERKLTEQALKKSEEQYRYLFDNNPASIFIWYLHDSRIAVANQTAIDQYGYTPQEFQNMSFPDLLADCDLPRIKEFSEKASRSETFQANGTWKHINRSLREMYMQTSSHRITYNDKPAILALALNVTDKLALENKLQEEKIKKNRQITQAVISAQEKERESIGRELHDNINQILASSRLYLGLVKNDRKEYHPCIDETDKLINSAIEEIRLLSHSLIPPSMEEEEFADALDNIIEMSMAGGTFTIEKTVGHFEPGTITAELRLTIYRIIQEQLSNIIKHAQPLTVWVKLYPLGNKIILSIKDDGKGFEPTAKTTGVGLMNIKTRASLFNGELTVTSAPGKGCELTVYFNAPTS